MKRFIATKTESSKKALASQFVLFSKEKKIYDQIRFIDETGMERVRVNKDASGPTITPEEHLQNKSDRYYFTKSLPLRQGAVFVSPFDLNVENGVIEHPLKPMIRLATPVIDESGKRQGIIILNYMGSSLLKNIEEVLNGRSSNGTLHGASSEGMLLNSDGFWLYAPHPEDEWGFMLDNGASFARRYPQAWERISAMDEGMFYQDGDLYTFTTVTPLLNESLREIAANFEGNIETIHNSARGYRWKLLTRLPHITVEELYTRQLTDYRLFYMVITLIIAVMAFSYAHVKIGRGRSREVMRLAARVMDVTRDGVIISDAKRQVISVNHAFSALTGYTATQFIGSRSVLAHPDHHSPEKVDTIWESVSHGGHWEGEATFQRKGGESFPVHCTLSGVCDSHGKLINYVEIFSDISQHKLFEGMAHHDALTGLPNRVLLADRLEMGIANAHRHDHKLALLFIDLNRFKPINDQYGHEVGDEVLRQVSLILRSCVRENDTVARMGGDEFVVLMQEVKKSEDIATLINKIQDSLRMEVRLVGQNLTVGASIGYAVYPDDGKDPELLLRKADLAMYKDKDKRSV